MLSPGPPSSFLADVVTFCLLHPAGAGPPPNTCSISPAASSPEEEEREKCC